MIFENFFWKFPVNRGQLLQTSSGKISVGYRYVAHLFFKKGIVATPNQMTPGLLIVLIKKDNNTTFLIYLL